MKCMQMSIYTSASGYSNIAYSQPRPSNKNRINFLRILYKFLELNIRHGINPKRLVLFESDSFLCLGSGQHPLTINICLQKKRHAIMYRETQKKIKQKENRSSKLAETRKSPHKRGNEIPCKLNNVNCQYLKEQEMMLKQ